MLFRQLLLLHKNRWISRIVFIAALDLLAFPKEDCFFKVYILQLFTQGNVFFVLTACFPIFKLFKPDFAVILSNFIAGNWCTKTIANLCHFFTMCARYFIIMF